MNLLALDTTLETCSVAVSIDGAVAAQQAEHLVRGHAEALMPMIDAVLAAAGIGYADLDAVGITVGPGSFTGQRVGLSAARGIGLARQIPVQGVTTLDAIAFGVDADGLAAAGEDVLVALDARRGQLYVQHYPRPLDWPQSRSAAAAITLAEIADQVPDGPCVVVGSGVALVRAALGARPGLRYLEAPGEAAARHVAGLALCEIQANGAPTAPPAPLYLRPPDAKLPGGKAP